MKNNKRRMYNFLPLILFICTISTNIFANKSVTTSDIYAQALQTMQRSSETKTAFFASISCFIIDLKFTAKEEIKILELGNLHDSRFKVLDNLSEPGTVWKAFWKTLEPYNLPIFAVGNFDHQDCACNYLNKIGGLSFPSFSALKQNRFFQKLAQKKSCSSLDKIANNKGIIVTRCSGENTQSKYTFKQEYPDFIIANMEIGKYARYKNQTCKIFDSPKLKKFRPRFGVYKKRYSKDLIRKIINDIHSDYYVIKPTNSFSGNGIIIIPEEELDQTLKLILDDYNNNIVVKGSVYNPKIPLTLNYWKHDKNSRFIVEEFVESKYITIDGENYDATMRIIVAPRYDDDGKITLHLLDSYWKRPLKSIEKPGNFREKHISKHSPTYEESVGCLVNIEDRKKVEKILEKIIPEIYWNALLHYYTEWSR
ncbi:MAG: hypothetical protein V1855_04170 [bacterium]